MRYAMFILGLIVLATTAQAGETPKLSGFADASYLYDKNADVGEFGVDQVEIDLEHRAGERTLVRADVEWVKDGNEFVAQVEQAYMAYTCKYGLTYTFGQFNAPIGFELLDAPDMYQFSHALVFDYGLPTNLTGLSVARDLGEHFDIIAYGTNGWDANAASSRHVTFGGRLGYVAPNGAGLGISAISGKERDDMDVASTRTVFDADLSYEVEDWLFGGEFNKGKVTFEDDSEAEWTGFLVMTHYTVNEWLGFTARYDYFDDADGYAFGDVAGEFQARQAITLAPTLTLDDGFGALLEFRVDMSDQDAFLDTEDQATDSNTTVAFEVTYSW